LFSIKFNEGQALSSVFLQFPPTGWRATTRVLIIVLTGVVALLCWLGWYGYERRKVRKKIKENEAEMARIKEEMDELEVKIAQNSKFIALLEKMRHPFGFDKYRWN